MKYATFIITHNRPINIPTISSLRKTGFNLEENPWYLVVDDQDPQLELYKTLYTNLLIFNKLDKFESLDLMDNFKNMKLSIYARQACQDFAVSLGFENYLMLDDDYTGFRYRVKDGNKLIGVTTSNIEAVFQQHFKFLNSSNIKVLALSQGGDFIGGLGSGLFKSKLKRKSMNGFFCRTTNDLKFTGTMNEDVNTYILDGQRGFVHLTTRDFSLEQLPSQSSSNGLTEMYEKYGTYNKSFYSVICRPDCVKISIIGPTHKRLHHKINWETCSPKIISSNIKKEQNND